MCSLTTEPSKLSRETIQNAFFLNYAPFFTLTVYPLSGRVLAPACSAFFDAGE